MDVGTVIDDRYRVDELIGRGGVASVWRVHHVKLGGKYALKVLHTDSEAVKDRLVREGRAQAELRHPNLVAVSDLVIVDGDPGLVMEFVEGPSLDRWLLDHHPNLDEGLELFRAIVRGVRTAHDAGLVHRDLKPSNVLLFKSDAGWVPKVCDFGLVKAIEGDRPSIEHTFAGNALGTPGYMAPEQIENASNVDLRADLFSLGCILYELVCHRRAFPGTDPLDVMNLVAAGRYTAPERVVAGLKQPIADAIRSLLQVDPSRRLGSADALLELLDPDRIRDATRVRAPASDADMKAWLYTLAGLAGFALISLPVAWYAAQQALATPPRPPAPTALADVLDASLPTTTTLGAVDTDTEATVDTEAAAEVDLGGSPSTTDDAEDVADSSSGEPTETRDPPTHLVVRTRPRSRIEVVGGVPIYLVDEEKSWPPTAPIPVGPYRLIAWFGGPEWEFVGRVRVRPDETFVVTCDAALRTCATPE